MKVLMVQMTDDWYTNCTGEPPRRRVVIVPLTPEQEAMVKPRSVGSGPAPDGKGQVEHFEEVNVICIQEQEGDAREGPGGDGD